MFKLVIKSDTLGSITHIFNSLTEINTYLNMISFDEEKSVIIEQIKVN